MMLAMLLMIMVLVLVFWLAGFLEIPKDDF